MGHRATILGNLGPPLGYTARLCVILFFPLRPERQALISSEASLALLEPSNACTTGGPVSRMAISSLHRDITVLLPSARRRSCILRNCSSSLSPSHEASQRHLCATRALLAMPWRATNPISFQTTGFVFHSGLAAVGSIFEGTLLPGETGLTTSIWLQSFGGEGS